jgi:hypothetical protein
VLIPLITYLLLFVVPLVVIPGIDLRFEPPKVLISEILIICLAVYVIATGKFSLKRASKPLLGILGCLFLLSFFHLIVSPSQQNLFGNVFRLQGTILFWHFLLLAIIAQNIWFRLKEKYIYMSALLAVVAGSLVFGSNSAGRWVGSLGEPNALGAVVVLIFPFVFLSFKSIWVKILSVLLALFVINFTESRSAFIGMGLELFLLMVIKISKGKYILASIITMIVLILSLGLPILDRIYFLKTNTNPLNYRFEDRAEIWNVAGLAGLESPIIGSGIESIQEKIHRTAQKINVNAQYQVIDSSHNLLFDYWIWGGSIGLFMILTLVILTIKNLSKKKMLIELAVFIGLLTVLSFNPTTVPVLAGFWWIIGRSFVREISD